MAVLGLGVKYRERRYLMRNTREIGLFPRVSGEGAVPIPETLSLAPVVGMIAPELQPIQRCLGALVAL